MADTLGKISAAEKAIFAREMKAVLQDVNSAFDRFQNLTRLTTFTSEITDQDIFDTFQGYSLAMFSAAITGLTNGISKITPAELLAIRTLAGVKR